MKSLNSFIFIVIAAALGYVYAWPQWQKIQTLTARETELTGALEKANQIEVIKQELVTKYDAISETDTKKISKVVPVRFDPIKLVADINDIAARYNLVIRETKFGEDASVAPGGGVVKDVQPMKSYQTITLNFNTSGQYRSLYSFISDLEKSLQLMDIQKVSIAPAQKGKESDSSLNFNITLDTYWMN